MSTIGNVVKEILANSAMPHIESELVSYKLNTVLKNLNENDLFLAMLAIQSSYRDISLLLEDVKQFESMVALVLNQTLSVTCALISKAKKSRYRLRFFSLLFGALDALHKEEWTSSTDFASFKLNTAYASCFKEIILELATILQEEATEMVDKLLKQKSIVLAFEIEAALANMMQLMHGAQIKHPWNRYGLISDCN